MTSLLARTLGGAALALVAATGAMAQESTNQVAVMTDWSVFTEPKDGTPKECWGVSSPKQTVNTKDGQPVSVRRGDILRTAPLHGVASHCEACQWRLASTYAGPGPSDDRCRS